MDAADDCKTIHKFYFTSDGQQMFWQPTTLTSPVNLAGVRPGREAVRDPDRPRPW